MSKNIATKKTDLEIIVVNYNGMFWLKKMLTTLKEHVLSHTKYTIDVSVIDNGSTDDSVQLLKREFRWAHVTVLPENLGFAAGNNVALQNSTARYSMLINSDIELTANSNIDLLIAYMDENTDVGVITPKVVLANGRIDMASHRGEPTPWASLAYFSGLSRIFPNNQLFAGYHQTYKNFDAIHGIDACSGAAMLVRRSAVKKIGLLDERFFMYAEDLDWCTRFRAGGYQIVYFPQVTVIHHKYKSGIKSDSPRTSHKMHALFYDTMLLYYDKHHAAAYPKWYRLVLKIILFIKKGGV